MATENRFKMSQERLDALKKELLYLETDKAKEVAEQIKEARSFGDLSENSEYDEARTEQAKVEARIKELEEKVNNAIIIDESKIDLSVISVGSTVKGYNVTDDEEFEYSLVGSNEADPMNGRISDLAPVGKALIGKRAGDTVTVETPGGELKLEVKEVSRTKSHE